MQEEWLTHHASAASTSAIYVSGGRAWHIPDGSSIPYPLEVGPGKLIDIVGHPNRYEVIAAVRQDDWCELRYINITTGETRVIRQTLTDVSILGWAAPDIILAATHDDRTPITTLTPIHLTFSALVDTSIFPDLTHVKSIDYSSSGALVMTTGAVDPSTWRAYRGGGKGQILIVQGQSSRVLSDLDNASSAVIMGERIYYLDDSNGPVDVYSLPMDGNESPKRHTWFSGLGGVSLRRGENQLIVCTPGQSWSLTPESNELRQLPGPANIAGDTIPAATSVVESAVPDSSATYLAVRGAGVLTLLEKEGLPAWSLPRGYEWVVDNDWSVNGQLFILVRSQSEYSVLKLEPQSKIIQAYAVPGADGLYVEHIVALAAGVILSSNISGIAVVDEISGIRWITRGWSYRRSRPRVSPDGQHIAWTEANSHQGAHLYVANLTTYKVAVLFAAGQDLTAPTFDPSGRLLFLSRLISPIAGTASPLTGATVVCRVLDDGPLLDQIHNGRTEVVHRDPAVLHGMFEHNGLWLRSSKGLQRLNGSSPEVNGSLIGDDRSPISTASGTTGTYLTVPGPSKNIWFLTSHVQPHRARTILEQVFHLLKSQNLRDVLPTVRESVLKLAYSAQHPDDICALVTAVVREVGVSHATVISKKKAQPSLAALSEVALLRDRAASQVAPTATYLALPDVSSRGVQLVERLCRTWSGDAPLVLDLRYNSGGQFADHLHALLSSLLSRRTSSISPYGDELDLLTGPSHVFALVNEYTGSGGEHLAALLSDHPKVTVMGRRTLGAGTAFHQIWTLTAHIDLALPQYQLRGSGARNYLENRGLTPHVIFPADFTKGINFDDAMVSNLLAPDPTVLKSPTTAQLNTP